VNCSLDPTTTANTTNNKNVKKGKYINRLLAIFSFLLSRKRKVPSLSEKNKKDGDICDNRERDIKRQKMMTWNPEKSILKKKRERKGGHVKLKPTAAKSEQAAKELRPPSPPGFISGHPPSLLRLSQTPTTQTATEKK
jgi:hypothetical protein